MYGLFQYITYWENCHFLNHLPWNCMIGQQNSGEFGIRDLRNNCFVHFIFRFWFLVTFGDRVTKIQKYYVIFVYILQGKMGKMEKNGKKIMQLKWPKYQCKRRNKWGEQLKYHIGKYILEMFGSNEQRFESLDYSVYIRTVSYHLLFSFGIFYSFLADLGRK